MSVTVVVKSTSDLDGACPPVCQVIMGLCYSPACFFKSPHKWRLQGPCQSVLGALEILVGMLNIGFGSIVYTNSNNYNNLEFPFWLGAVFIFCGVIRMIWEKFPHPCLVITNMGLILAEFVFAIAAMALYTSILSMPLSFDWNSCGEILNDSGEEYDSLFGRNYRGRNTHSSDIQIMRRKCQEAEALFTNLLNGMNIVLLILSILALFIVIITVILRIDALCNGKEGENKEKLAQDTEDSELCKAPQEDDPINLVV